jgi:hypothetical protein
MTSVTVQEYLRLKITLNCDDTRRETNRFHQNTHNLAKELSNSISDGPFDVRRLTQVKDEHSTSGSV